MTDTAAVDAAEKAINLEHEQAYQGLLKQAAQRLPPPQLLQLIQQLALIQQTTYVQLRLCAGIEYERAWLAKQGARSAGDQP